jgi:hypothetical protein
MTVVDIEEALEMNGFHVSTCERAWNIWMLVVEGLD